MVGGSPGALRTTAPCHGVAPALFRCCERVVPLYNPCTTLVNLCGLRSPCGVSTEPRPGFDSIGLAVIQRTSHLRTNRKRRHSAARSRGQPRRQYPPHCRCRSQPPGCLFSMNRNLVAAARQSAAIIRRESRRRSAEPSPPLFLNPPWTRDVDAPKNSRA